MADVVERLVFDDSLALPVLKNVSESLNKTSKDMQALLDLMSKEASKSAQEMVNSESKVNEAVIKTSLSMKEARKELSNRVKDFGAFGLTIGGGIEKLKELKEMLSLVRQGLIGNVKPTQTQADGINKISDAIKGMLKIAKDSFSNLLTFIVTAFTNPKQTIQSFFDSIKTGVTNSKDFFKNGFTSIKDILTTTFTAAKKLAVDSGTAISKAFANPKQTIKDLYDSIKTNIVDGLKAVPGIFSNIGSGITNAFGAGVRPAITSFVTGMNLVRASILATGVGALIIALTGLIAFFTQTNEGADKIARTMQGLRAVFRVLIDTVAPLGKAMVEAFSNPKQAVIDLYNAIKENLINRVIAIPDIFGAIGKSIKNAFTGNIDEAKENLKQLGTATTQFVTGFDEKQQKKIGNFFGNLKDEAAKAFQDGQKLFDKQEALYERETDLILRVASLRRQVNDLRFISKDETESYAARIKAAEKSLELERQLINAEVETARIRLSVIREENRLKGLSVSKEDRRTEVEAVTAVDDAVSNASKLLRDLNKTHQNLIQEAKREFTSAVENLVEVRDSLISNAKEFNLISTSQEQTFELQKQLDLLNEQRKSILAISTFFVVATGQNPFTKELELTEKLIQRVTTQIERGGTLEPIEPISPTSSTRIKELNEELTRLQKLSIDLNVDTSLAQKEVKEKIDELTKEPIKSTQKVDLNIEVIPPQDGDPFEKSFAESFQYVINDINDFIDGLEDAEDLLNKTLDRIFGESGGEKAREFIGGLFETFKAYSSIFQESSSLQIEKNNEIIKQKEEQRQKLEDELDYELDLQEQGLANNVGTKQQEVDQLLSEQERYEKENEAIKKKAQKNQLILDTISQGQSLITSSINIIKGFSNIPIVGLPLGIAAVASLISFFAATKAKAFAATKLFTGAKRIDDHFGFVDRFGDSDKGAGQGYAVINARTGKDTNVRISGKEMLIPEGPSLIHSDFLYDLSKGVYNNIPLNEIAQHYENFNTTEDMTILNNVINNTVSSPTINNITQQIEAKNTKQWVPIEKDGKKGYILLELPENRAAGSTFWTN